MCNDCQAIVLKVMMTNVASQVLATVNAPYGANLSACQLAAKISDPKSVSAGDASVFSFFSEVSPELQKQFIDDFGLDFDDVNYVASQMADLSGYDLPLAA